MKNEIIQESLLNIFNKLNCIEGNIYGLRTDATGLQEDMSALKLDISNMKVDMKNMRDAMFHMQGNLESIHVEISDLKSQMVEIYSNLNVLASHIEAIDTRTHFYPKFYDNVDKLCGEIVEHRKERLLLSNRLRRLEAKF